RPDVAGVDQALRAPFLGGLGICGPSTFVVADGERSDPAASAAFARKPASDHKLLRQRVLHLEPVARAFSGLVDAAEALRHDALEGLGLCRFEQGFALSDVIRGRLPVRPRELEVLEEAAALL